MLGGILLASLVIVIALPITLVFLPAYLVMIVNCGILSAGMIAGAVFGK